MCAFLESPFWEIVVHQGQLVVSRKDVSVLRAVHVVDKLLEVCAHICIARPLIVRSDEIEIPLAVRSPWALMLVFQSKGVASLVTYDPVELSVVGKHVVESLKVHAWRVTQTLRPHIRPVSSRCKIDAYVAGRVTAAVRSCLK